MVISMARLRAILSVKVESFVWNENDAPITAEEVKSYKGRGSFKPFGDLGEFRPDPRSRSYHLKRVVYFYRHPEKIKGIEIMDRWWRDRYRSYSFPSVEIEDGWHRLLAAMCLDLNKLDIKYVGCRQDILNYLTGHRRSRPTRTICY